MMNPDKRGTVLTLPDGHRQVRFERHLPYSCDQVWRALTDPDRLASWFPGFTLEHRAGGTFRIWFGGECEGPAHVEGTVVAFDPPNLLQCGGMRWELRPEADGCVLLFTDILVYGHGDQSEQEIEWSVLGGWHRYLDMLEDLLHGRPVVADGPEPDYSAV